MNDALAAVVEAQIKKVSCSSKARQYKSSAPRTWLEWMPAQNSFMCNCSWKATTTTLCCVTGVERWFRAAPRDICAQRVARENRQRARKAREAVPALDDEGTLSCAVLLTMSERE